MVGQFIEKPKGDDGWVNAGFMVLEPEFIERYTTNDQSILESEGLQAAALDKNLAAYKHTGFWQAMDTVREHNHLNHLWSADSAPWKVWDDAPIVRVSNPEVMLSNQSLVKFIK
jgi:glucose-1-phosphate cytidylyltransferase